MTTTNSAERYRRNYGFISQTTQINLAQADIAIAGVGGVGGKVATDLVRLGITKLRLADPDTFSVTNLNRQEGSYTRTIGALKVDVIAAACRDINPEVQITVYPEGVTADNLDAFMNDATLLVEATDFMSPHLGVMLARAARHGGIPVVMGVELGFGATLAWFKPTGFTYEQHLGLSPNVDLEDLKHGTIEVNFKRWIPHVPRYGDLKILQQVADGKTDVPAIAPAVAICSALITTQIISLHDGSNGVPPAPVIYHYDARERRSRIIHYPMLHHRLSLLRMVLNNLLGRQLKM